MSPVRARGWLLALGPLLLLAVLLAYPLGRLLWGSLSLEALSALSNPYYGERLGWTLLQASVSTLATVALGVPAAIAFSRYRFRGKGLLLALLTLPFVVPATVAAVGLLALFGPGGLTGVNLQGTAWLVLGGNVFYNYALVVRIVSGHLAGLGRGPEEAARVLGSGPARAFLRVTLPLAAPGVLAAAALVFLYTFASFSLPLLLGGPEHATLEVEIYTLVAYRLRLGEAGALALVQMAVTFAAALLYTGAGARAGVALDFAGRERPARGWARAWLGLNVLVALLVTLGPLAALVARSFAGPDGPTLAHYTRAVSGGDGLFSASLPLPLGNTLGFAAATLLLAVPVGLAWALAIRATGSRLLDAASLLPLAVSAVTVSAGYLVAYPGLRASLALLLGAYSLAAYPLVARSVLPALRALPPGTLEAARTLGSSPLRALARVALPLLRPALATGAALAYASVVGEFAATLVLTRPEWATLTTTIYDRLGRPGGLGEATALSVILLAVAASGFLLLDRVRGRVG